MAGLFGQTPCTQVHVSNALPSYSDVLTAGGGGPTAGGDSLAWGKRHQAGECTPSRHPHTTLPRPSSPSSRPMSKWLGLRRSGARSPTSSASALPPDDVPAFLGKQNSSVAACSTPTPRTGRRRSSEETVDADTSRRSSRDDEDAQKGAAPADHGRGPGDGVSDECCDWEVVQHTSADFSGLVSVGGEAEAERPLSPGVDFSAAYMVDREGEEGRQAGASASDCDGNDTCRWRDAASIHSFLVRGPTYLQVGASLSCAPAKAN
ncbi:unnamed protein product [Ectocarpus sp. CCAP 1310/34]|nr:unnamed protein product [Ectocarpus sp. CCAP 1310/34]